MTSTGRYIVLTSMAAAGLALSSPSLARDGGPAFMPAGDVADAPSGFVELCARNAVLCNAGLEPVPVRQETMRAATPAISLTSTGPISLPLLRPVACQPALPTMTFATRFSGFVFQPKFLSPFNNFGGLPRSGLNGRSDVACAPGLGEMPLAAPFAPQIAPAILQGPTPLPATSMAAAQEFAFVKTINSEVNRAIRPMADYQTVGTDERWDRPGRGKYLVGDCEDFAIEKRMRLIEAGFAPNKLFYSVAYVKGYGMHIVLIARLQSGDMVLDNISPHVLPWTKVKYSWLRVQSTRDPMEWHRVGVSSGSSQVASAGRASVTG